MHVRQALQWTAAPSASLSTGGKLSEGLQAVPPG